MGYVALVVVSLLSPVASNLAENSRRYVLFSDLMIFYVLAVLYVVRVEHFGCRAVFESACFVFSTAECEFSGSGFGAKENGGVWRIAGARELLHVPGEILGLVVPYLVLLMHCVYLGSIKFGDLLFCRSPKSNFEA